MVCLYVYAFDQKKKNMQYGAVKKMDLGQFEALHMVIKKWRASAELAWRWKWHHSSLQQNNQDKSACIPSARAAPPAPKCLWRHQRLRRLPHPRSWGKMAQNGPKTVQKVVKMVFYGFYSFFLYKTSTMTQNDLKLVKNGSKRPQNGTKWSRKPF